jgi:hypothetical protein
VHGARRLALGAAEVGALAGQLRVASWKARHAAWELRVSHWSGPLAQLEVWLDWSYGGRWHHLFGRLTYRGAPVFGFATTPSGQPLDGYGRVVYVDTRDSLQRTLMARSSPCRA